MSTDKVVVLPSIGLSAKVSHGIANFFYKQVPPKYIPSGATLELINRIEFMDMLYIQSFLIQFINNILW